MKPLFAPLFALLLCGCADVEYPRTLANNKLACRKRFICATKVRCTALFWGRLTGRIACSALLKSKLQWATE
jgi:hypothetical protein